MKACSHQQWSILFIFISEIFSSVGESNSSVKEVNGIVEGYFTFPTQIPVYGTIVYNSFTIGQIFNSQSKTDQNEKFKNRLHWNRQSGLFTLSHLRFDDSGLYTLHNTEVQTPIQNYQLKVYEKVSGLQVKKGVSGSSEDEVCTLLCSVKNTRELKLSWFNDKILLNQTSSFTLNTTLDFPLKVKKEDNYNLTCEASNPVSNQTTSINITEICFTNSSIKKSEEKKQHVVIYIVFAVLSVAAVALMCCYIKRRKSHQSSQHTEELTATEGQNIEVQYSEINHKKHLKSNLHEPASEETQQLTTIYDKIRPRE